MSDAPWTDVLGSADLPETTLTRAAFGDAAVLLYRAGDDLFAIAQRCTHAGMPLDKSRVASGILTCPAHGSQFRLEDGRVVRPPAQQPLATYDVREADGRIELRPR
jgi:nitrite reductase/ring-hydroxylating ferredoxin subunit